MSPPTSRTELGTFLGVYAPSLLTILGVVLFLRTGWVVGNVGLVPALAIVVVAHVITLSTALSVAAIATNMRVGAGGAYYMISRSLGLEIGGAIGVPLFLAQTFSVTLYAFGLAEASRLFWPDLPMGVMAAVTILVISAVAGRSTHLVLKLQIPILALIAIGIGALLVGTASRASETLPLWHGSTDGENVWVVFAVFFPAVTGLMAGVSLSGDLKNPKRSIPLGTLLAVGTGFVVYLVVPVALAAAAGPETLVAKPLIWFELAAIPMLVLPGLLGAILSSAVGSILGAPRTLEALLEDRVLPRPPAWLDRKLGGNLAHIVATAVALGAVALGDLNAVAPVLTMFFLTTYGMVNLVAGLEQLSGSPSYRPTIRVPWFVSLAGAVGCVWVMWLINPWAALAAVVIEIFIYVTLRRRLLNAAWGDLRYGALMSLARSTLLKLRQLPVDPRNWRPHILVFAGDTEKRIDLVRFAAWLNQGRGILTVNHLLIGSFDDLVHRVEGETRRANEYLEREGFVAFAETGIVSDFESGVLAVCQANGIGGVSSNTLMLGWSEKPARRKAMLRIVDKAARLGRSTLVCRIVSRRWSSKLRRIDVWWGGLQRNGDMLLLFAHLLSLNPEWNGVRISVKSVASSSLSYEQNQRNLESLLERCRIRANSVVFHRPEKGTVIDLIHEQSCDADLVFLGLQASSAADDDEYSHRLAALVGDLPTVILVRAAGPFAGQLLESSVDAE